MTRETGPGDPVGGRTGVTRVKEVGVSTGVVVELPRDYVFILAY